MDITWFDLHCYHCGRPFAETTDADHEPCFGDWPGCPIKGHDHDLGYVRSHVQQSDGKWLDWKRAHTLECPTGRYRFFYIPHTYRDSNGALGLIRHDRPRWGWKDTS